MKLQIPTSIIRNSLFAGVLTCAVAASAVSVPSTTQALATGDQQNQYQFVRRGVESEKLREAYQIMAWANADYDGHKGKAMHAVEEAGKLIGMNLKNEGRGHERQSVSDAQLRHARELLIEVRDIVVGQKRVIGHVDVAIHELNVALKIK